jgi:hypothetical protein
MRVSAESCGPRGWWRNSLAVAENTLDFVRNRVALVVGGGTV